MPNDTEVAPSRLSTRLATQADAQVILSFDDAARAQRERVNFIYRTIASRNCHVVVADTQVVGYGVLEYTFFDHGYISMLYVNADFRRRGAATALLSHLERMCKTPKLFTSMRQSNTDVQNLLAAANYRASGSIENLSGDGEAEMVYCKALR